MAEDRYWYKYALFYELFVCGFYDSNGDGIGDLPGVCEKLDYLKWLGVDCIWLLPIFDTPFKDAGYDVRDFYSIYRPYGTLDDFKNLLNAAHSRGIRVIIDLVLNHTSDQHPWFQEARSSPSSPRHNWYVWSDTPDKFRDVPVIFTDYEKSNWTFDEVAGKYYWHRFFSHQPDLNYDNPEVRREMLNMVDFWLSLGVDGFRLDAVPYLYEREGTLCENLPETHAFLKELRAFMDSKYESKVLLAEANEDLPELVKYFGNGDECHMCFNFPLMPRLFLSLRQEQKHPMSEVLAKTPPIPENCQWSIFLRNHDELTLSKVSEEEFDYMLHEFGYDQRSRVYRGLRRRLAPLLGNGRRQMELFMALLLSLPGSPVIYYGDEIGMGDNLHLGDRNAVRTPMQWSSDRNGGFSKADFADLYLPPLMDPVYGYQAVNVEAQTRSITSFLHWCRRFIDIRKQHSAFADGEYLPIETSNEAVFAFVRRNSEEVLLCVNNLSRFAQPCYLNLSKFKDQVPLELVGRIRFPVIQDDEYVLTLGPHGFYWFQLRQD